MMRINKSNRLYLLLILIWASSVLWIFFEHWKFVETTKTHLVNKAKDYTTLLQVALNSQPGRGAPFVPNNLTSLLKDLVDYTEMRGVVLINANEDRIAQAGEIPKINNKEFIENKVIWEKKENLGIFTNVTALPAEYFHDRRPEKINHFNAEINIDEFIDRHFPEHNRKNIQNLLRKEKNINKQDIQLFISSLPDRLQTSQIRLICHKELEDQQLTEQKLIGLIQMIRTLEMSENPRGRQRIDRLNSLRKLEATYFVVIFSTKYEMIIITKDLFNRITISSVSFLILILLILMMKKSQKNLELKTQIILIENQSEALKDLNMAAAGIVHETKNPLNLIRGLAQMITLTGINNKNTHIEMQNSAKKIVEEADIISGRLNQFLSYSKPRNPQYEIIDLKSLINELFELIKYDCEDKNIALKHSISTNYIGGDREMLRQIIFNLLINSVQSLSKNGGEILLEFINDTERKFGNLYIYDNGCGIKKDIFKEIFRPYFTTNEQGTGLGLSIVRQLAVSNNWQIELLPNQELTTFVIKNIIIETKI